MGYSSPAYALPAAAHTCPDHMHLMRRPAARASHPQDALYSPQHATKLFMRCFVASERAYLEDSAEVSKVACAPSGGVM